MRAIVWDLEIQESPESEADWEKARKGELGVSCVVLYDSATQKYYIYDETELDECLVHLNEADILIGYNTLGFDAPCLQGFTNGIIEPVHVDLLQDIWDSLGKHTKGFKLGQVSQRTLGAEKYIENGETAVHLFKTGKLAKLYTYCMHDVALTKDLFNFIETNGYVVGTDGKPVKLEKMGLTI